MSEATGIQTKYRKSEIWNSAIASIRFLDFRDLFKEKRRVYTY